MNVKELSDLEETNTNHEISGKQLKYNQWIISSRSQRQEGLQQGVQQLCTDICRRYKTWMARERRKTTWAEEMM